MLANGLFLNFLSHFITLEDYSLDFLVNGQSLFIYIFYLALIPAICEEVLFRGLLKSTYDFVGVKFSIGLSAFVFALFHFDIQNFIAPFLLGILFANIQEDTNSIYGAILAHFTNNIIGIISVRFNYQLFSRLSSWKIVSYFYSIEDFIIIVLIFLSIISLFSVRLLFRSIKKEIGYEYIRREARFNRSGMLNINFKGFIPLILFGLIYVSYHFINR